MKNVKESDDPWDDMEKDRPLPKKIRPKKNPNDHSDRNYDEAVSATIQAVLEGISVEEACDTLLDTQRA